MSGSPAMYWVRTQVYVPPLVPLKDVRLTACQPLLFMIFYLTYKFITPCTRSVKLYELTAGDYVLGDLSTIEGQDPVSGASEEDGTELEAHRDSTATPHTFDTGLGINTEEQEAYEAKQALEQERRGIEAILERRPLRMPRSLLRELWSCIIADSPSSSPSLRT